MNTTKYQFIMRKIRDRIEKGFYAPGLRLPSERAISQEFSTNHETANKAISNLVAEGLLYRRRGIGTFISGPSRGEKTQHLTIDILLYKKASEVFQSTNFHEELLFIIQQNIVLKGCAGRIVPVIDIGDFSSYIQGTQAVILSNFIPHRYIKDTQEAGIPILSLDFGFTIPGTTEINIDNQALNLLCRHLVELGHKKIGFIRSAEFVPEQHLKEYHFKKFMQLMELPGNISRIYAFDPEADAVGTNFTAAVQECTALVAADDFLAIMVNNFLRRINCKVPQDISLTGFGNLSLTKTLFPELTTADVDRKELCETLVEESLQMIRYGKESTRIDFSTFPVIRSSTGKPREQPKSHRGSAEAPP